MKMVICGFLIWSLSFVRCSPSSLYCTKVNSIVFLTSDFNCSLFGMYENSFSLFVLTDSPAPCYGHPGLGVCADSL